MSPGTRFALFVSVALGIWLLEHVYVGWRLLSLPLVAQPALRRSVIVVVALGLLSYPAARLLHGAGWLRVAAVLEVAGAVWIGVLFLLLVWLLAAEVVTLGGLVLRPWVVAIRTGAVAVALLAAAVALVEGALAPRVLEVELALPGLPAALDGTTLVQVSDIHLDGTVGRRRLERLVRAVTALEPELLLVVGDVVDSSVRDVEPLAPLLRELRAPLGVFGVLGNHEYYAGAEASRRLFREVGFDLLDNRAVAVAGGLVVAGVPDRRGARETGEPGPDLAGTLAGVPPGSAVVLLQHSPEEEQQAAAAGVGLMLCGHTHGGQIWPFNYLVQLIYPHLAGVYTVGAMTQVVSRGAGLWGPPMRLFAPSDIVRVTLRCPASPVPPNGTAGTNREDAKRAK